MPFQLLAAQSLPLAVVQPRAWSACSSACYLLFSAIGRARRASLQAAPPLRGQLIAFVLGTVGVGTAVFFVDLHKPWFYFWMYAGVVMRLVLCVGAGSGRPRRRRRVVQRPTVRRDPYGWAQLGDASP